MLVGDRYELVERLGTGGFSEVWRATDTVLSRPVAIKMLHGGYHRQAEALARFQAEARHAGALSHENIARIYDYAGPADDREPYLVMELVDGPSLDGLLASGPLGAARTMDLIAQAAAGLQAAHEVGLLHRDIKPANLLLTRRGTVKITDFGIAHAVGAPPVTVTGMLVGTPGYMAPERVSGAQAVPASDLYALGIVAYECLAGAPPFSGVPLAVALAHRERPLPPLPMSVPPDVTAFVMQLTAKDPRWRPGSAAEAARRAVDLRDALSRTPAAPRPAVPAIPAQAAPPDARMARADNARPPSRAKRRPSTRVVSCAMLAGLGGLALAGFLGFAPPLHQVNNPSSTSSGQSQTSGPAVGHHTSQSQRPLSPAAAVSAPTANDVAASPRQPSPQPGHATHQHGGNKPAGGSGHGKGHGNQKGSGNTNAQVLGG
jgi:serine/threonine-protein kinase